MASINNKGLKFIWSYQHEMYIFVYILELDNNQHISFWLDKSLVAMA